MSTLPTSAKKAARRDPRIVELVTYPDGWLPNSYRYRAPGRRIVYRRNGARHWTVAHMESIDRKRARGAGPEWVGRSDCGGTLASG